MITNEIKNNMRSRAGELYMELIALRNFEKESDDFLPDVCILIEKLTNELQYLMNSNIYSHNKGGGNNEKDY